MPVYNMASSGLKKMLFYTILNFLEHLNSIDHHIQFTSKESRPDGSMPFLDILITPKEDGSLSITVYRKPTHTDLYLQWDSNHTVSSKYSVVRTLHHRAQIICSSPQLLQQEEKHLQQALTRCKYPAWVLNRIKIKTKTTAYKIRRGTNNSGNNNQRPYLVIPYHKGVSESIKKTCSKHKVQVYFKGVNTKKDLLVAPKDQNTIHKKSGVVYRYKCDRVECDKEYIGKSSKNIWREVQRTSKGTLPNI